MKPEQQNWIKIWTTEYSLFSIWLLGREYIKNCKKEVGAGFENIIFSVEGDFASLYRINEEQKKFINSVVKRLAADKEFSKNFYKNLSSYFEGLMALTQLSEQYFLTLDNFQKFIDLHGKFLPYYISNLWAPDALNEINIAKADKDALYKQCENFKTITNTVYTDLEKYLQKIFKYISVKENIEEKLLRAVLLEEFIGYVKNGILPDTAVLKKRYEYCVIVATKKQNKLHFGEEAKKIIVDLIKVDKEISELNGQVAYPGKVKGKVKIIFKSTELNNFKQNDILVTTMTRPDWLSAMKMASAYITDAGGILSHAAIVARELKKPCIIGTQIATQVLKDGDMVEVDADKGVVKIFK